MRVLDIYNNAAHDIELSASASTLARPTRLRSDKDRDAGIKTWWYEMHASAIASLKLQFIEEAFSADFIKNDLEEQSGCHRPRE